MADKRISDRQSAQDRQHSPADATDRVDDDSLQLAAGNPITGHGLRHPRKVSGRSPESDTRPKSERDR